MTTINGLHYFLPAWVERTDERLTCDLCVYGGTAAGVIAAVTAARLGLSSVIINPATCLGGMTTGGLGFTDFGQQQVIGGAARRFYRDLGAFYQKTNGEEEWLFEPHAAQTVLDGYVQDARIPVYPRQFLDAVEIDSEQRLQRIRLLSGLTVEARQYLDATYEGDLMAKAGVSYTMGRESNHFYGETYNGVQVRGTHQFSHPVDPYVVPGDPSSGTLPWVDQQDAAPDGSGDHRIQAYNFRICMTDDPELKIPWDKPEGHDTRDYELARRWYNSAKDSYNDTLRLSGSLRKFDALTHRTSGGYVKTDTNNHGPVSSDFIGASYPWPEASYTTRERLFQAHVSYQKGLYWTLANDPEIPARYREAFGRFGLSRDEFTDTGHWPHQLYVREARRMISDYVLTEKDALHQRKCEDPVGMGSYTLDSHNCSRFVRDGRVLNEGDVQVPPAGPYGVSYRALIPARGECPNLIVPVCLSTSHIAFGTVRMEPVFMVLAESAAIAAALAMWNDTTVQEVPYNSLRSALEDANQVLEAT